jgi:hypothetical protein
MPKQAVVLQSEFKINNSFRVEVLIQQSVRDPHTKLHQNLLTGFCVRKAGSNLRAHLQVLAK